MTTLTARFLTDAFDADADLDLDRKFLSDALDDDDLDLVEYCVGNSHLWIAAQYSAVSARCNCGSTVVLKTDGTWTHNEPGAMGRACPPYDCACGKRHNVRPV